MRMHLIILWIEHQLLAEWMLWLEEDFSDTPLLKLMQVLTPIIVLKSFLTEIVMLSHVVLILN